MRSLLNINLSRQLPLITTTIPFAGGQTGLPFCLKSDGFVTSFELVSECNSNGMPLNTSWVEIYVEFYYYAGNENIVDYLTGLGYSVPDGRYYFKIVIGGSTYYTSIFYLDTEDIKPTEPGDYNSDYNNDYYK